MYIVSKKNSCCFLNGETFDLSYVEFGCPTGKMVIYFHGVPGAPGECSMFDEYATTHDLQIICYDRFSVHRSLKGDAYYKFLAEVIIKKTKGKLINIIGFSIGCHAAIKTSLYLGERVHCLHLISAAAPLDGANFLPGMRGEKLFFIAMKYPIIFNFLSYWQCLLAKIWPKKLRNMLFARASGKDRELFKTEEFTKYITPLLVNCFSKNLQGYLREINQYVSPWSGAVLKCDVPVTLWHGLLDNWSPKSMAEYLDYYLPGPSTLKFKRDLSHYSCLFSVVLEICRELENEKI